MSMLQTGKYKFLATFPGIYKERPITHYHVKVSSKGDNNISQNTIFGEGTSTSASAVPGFEALVGEFISIIFCPAKFRCHL